MAPDSQSDTRVRETIVYGHRNNACMTQDGWPMPAIAGRTIGLDTTDGVLTAVRLPGGDIFQSARYNGTHKMKTAGGVNRRPSMP